MHEANHAPQLWKPHPDDEADVRDAMQSVECGEVLSVEASDAFLRWLEGSDDESWGDKSGQALTFAAGGGLLIESPMRLTQARPEVPSSGGRPEPAWPRHTVIS